MRNSIKEMNDKLVNHRLKRVIKISFFIGFCFASFLYAYWIKCQEQIDLFRAFSLGNYLPVQALQDKESIVFASESEEILSENFDELRVTPLWSKLWMREDGAVAQRYDPTGGVNHSRCLLIESKSEKDWSIRDNQTVAVKPGGIFSFSGDVRITGNASGTLSVITFDENKQVIRWLYAAQTVRAMNGWVNVKGKFVVSPGVGFIQFRLTGSGIGKIWFDNIVFRKEGEANSAGDLNQPYVLENDVLIYKLDLKEKTITVVDKRINKEWQDTSSLKNLTLMEAQPVGSEKIKLNVVNAESFDKYSVVIHVPSGRSEVDYEISKKPGEEFQRLEFPQFFDRSKYSKYVVPLHEGMLVPRDFKTEDFPAFRLYGGGWSMPFVGVTDGSTGWMEIVETPNDFELVRAQATDGKLMLTNRWISQKRKFGYNRRIKYCFFDKGGYVDMAKRYREYAKEEGLLLTLKEKEPNRKGNMQKLIGATDIWYWGHDKVAFAMELNKSGIKKVLFSSTDGLVIKTVNQLGYLSSTYDNYQDVWPLIYHDVTSRHDGWPEDLVVDQTGQWIKGWVIKKGFKEYPGGVICSLPGLAWAQKNIPAELKDKPYSARFIDTTTSSSWRECWNSAHSTTRSEDIRYKMKLLGFVSNDLGLVTGSEDGVDVAVPYVDYFEGMMSGIGRLPDSGRNVGSVRYMKPTEEFLKYQVGVDYRIPLWELVYHDSVVTTWYWGDSSNRIPEVWWRRDLFNILYGNMPLWAIRDLDHWKQYKDRFIESYKNVSPVFDKVGFNKMLSHRFITEDNLVQETEFEGDIRVVVNFGDNEYFLTDDNYTILSRGFIVFEKGKIWKEGVCN